MPKAEGRSLNRKPSVQFLNIMIVAGILTFGLALFAYAYLGTFSRYYADDYCLTSGFLSGGFWKSQIALYTSWSPRFAGTFVLNLSEYFGRAAIRTWTALVIVLWVFALTWLLVQASRLVRLPVSIGLALLIAEAIVFFTILEAPQQYQSFYWRIGTITYTLPLVFLAALLGLVFNRARKTAPDRISWWGVAVCAVIAFSAGGFSETYVTCQTAFLGMGLIGLWLGAKSPARRNWLVLAGAALIGSLLAMAVVVAAPGNAVRLAAIPTSRPDFLSLIRMSATSAFLFMYISLKDYSFQHLLALLVPMLATYGLYASGASLPKMRPSSLSLAFFVVPLISYLLILAVCLPSAYGESSYPEGRALVEARFIMVAMALAEGALIGMSLGQLHQWANEPVPIYLQWLTGLLFLSVALYPLYDARKTYREIPVYRDRAATWEARDAEIRTSVQQGILDINILDSRARSFDELSGLLEIGSDPEHWVNQCAASFYGAHNLTINQP